jgi:N-formylglutamate amidohydrolase
MLFDGENRRQRARHGQKICIDVVQQKSVISGSQNGAQSEMRIMRMCECDCDDNQCAKVHRAAAGLITGLDIAAVHFGTFKCGTGSVCEHYEKTFLRKK